MPDKRPIRVAVPVNLRPYFNSITTKNFFTVVSAEFEPVEDSYTFEEVLKITTESLHQQINKEHLEELFSYNVSNEKLLVARAVPLFLKNIAMRYVYTSAALANTSTVTNIGNVKVEEDYQPDVYKRQGSTGGGFKVSRLIIMVKSVRNEIMSVTLSLIHI